MRIIVGHYKLGLSAEEIADEMNLPIVGVYAALAYYHLNQEEIVVDILANREAAVMAEIASAAVRGRMPARSLRGRNSCSTIIIY